MSSKRKALAIQAALRRNQAFASRMMRLCLRRGWIGDAIGWASR